MVGCVDDTDNVESKMVERAHYGGSGQPRCPLIEATTKLRPVDRVAVIAPIEDVVEASGGLLEG
jgi:hypothetical protein